MVTEDVIVIVASELQPEKAPPPIEVTEAGLAKVTEDMAVQPEKAESPIVVTEDGIVIVASELQ